MKKLLYILLLCFCFSATAQDTLAPTITNIIFSDYIIDISNESQQFSVYVEYDDESILDLYDSYQSFYFPDSEVSFYPWGNPLVDYQNSLDTLNNMLITTWTFNQGMVPGDYCFERVWLSDDWSNHGIYYEFEHPHCIEVINNADNIQQDTIPPTITNIIFSDYIIDISNESQQFSVYVEYDDESILDLYDSYQSFYFPDSEVSFYPWGNPLVDYQNSLDTLNNMLITTWTFNQGMVPGDYCFERVWLSDDWSNHGIYYEFEHPHCIEVNYFLSYQEFLIDSLQIKLDSLLNENVILNDLTDSIVNQNLNLHSQIDSLQQELLVPNIDVDLAVGWNIIGFSCPQSENTEDALETIVDKLTIFKSNNGDAYLPEYGFNGIGDLTPGHGYQLKVTDYILDFNICE